MAPVTGTPHSIYFAFVTTAPSELDSPATATLFKVFKDGTHGAAGRFQFE